MSAYFSDEKHVIETVIALYNILISFWTAISILFYDLLAISILNVIFQ